jgi:uncharacterized protein YfaS (alpha-2-macroglobulin family)
MRRIEELTLQLLDGELDPEHEGELAELLADPEARRLHVALLEQEAALRGRADVELAEATLERIRDKRVTAGVLKELRARPSRYFRALLAAAALVAVVFGGFVAQSQLASAPPEELVLVGAPEMAPGREASFRAVFVDTARGTPIAGAPLEAALVAADGSEAWRGQAQTGADGAAVFTSALAADLAEGAYRLTVSSRTPAITLTQTVSVRRSFRLLLSSDKPRYQPGQTIHLRALALDAADGKPVAAKEIVFEVLDARGNKVFKRAVVTSRFGLAGADFALADQVITGGYRLAASLGDTRSERQAVIDRYVLPRFALTLETDRPYYGPGDAVSLALGARYTFGEPVADAIVMARAVQLVDGREVELPPAVGGKLDAEGRAELTLRAPVSGDARVAFEVTVKDAAGEERVAVVERVIAAQPIRIDVVRESRAQVDGVTGELFVLTSYPDGAPAQTSVRIGNVSAKTSASGVARLTVASAGSITVEAEDADGRRATRAVSLQYQGSPLLVRPERAVYRAGETLRAELIVSQPGPVFVDLVQDGRSISLHTVETAGGRGQLAVDLPAELSGTLTLSAYRVARGGTVWGDARLVQVLAPSDLSVKAELERARYRPGETARVAFTVTRPDGSPVPAALSLSAVDEAVYALGGKSALAESRYAIRRELLAQEADALPPSVLFDALDRNDDDLARSALAGRERPPAASGRGGHSIEEAALRSRKKEELALALALLGVAAFAGFLALVAPLWTRVLARFRRPTEADDPEIARLGRRMVASWVLAWLFPPLTLSLTRSIETFLVSLGLAVLAGAGFVAWSSTRLARRAADRDALLARAMRALPFAYVAAVVSLVGLVVGVEESSRFDDVLGYTGLALVVIALATTGAISAAAGAAAATLSRGQLGWRLASRAALGFVPVAFVTSFFLVRSSPERAEMGVALAPPQTAVTDTVQQQLGGQAPRLRRDFPETLLWRPELVTDEQGRATLELPLADSITTWRLDAAAVTGGGALGATSLGVPVFQEFFVDLGLPVALTQNDAVSVPAAVFNYTDREQTVVLELAPADWYALEGAAKREVTMAPRAVGRVEFRIVARRAGEHALRLDARAGDLADAVERRVRVAPDGDMVVDTINGTFDAHAEHTIAIPDTAIEGASDLVLKVYPGALSQVVEGLDGVFRMPSGCFEQTSSVTYPSVLALDYLRRAGRMPPELELRARGYINAGYQRLLGFEVPGGGFEWFGKSPAHTVLTAYGVLEFHDMARVHEVDPAVIERTREWLFSRQRADGVITATSDGIHEGAVNAMAGDDLRTTAYAAWALAESRQGDAIDPRLAKALDYVAANVEVDGDAYTLALAAMALGAAKHPKTESLLRALDDKKERVEPGVRWTSKVRGVTYSNGDALTIETTALAAQALLRDGYALDTAEQALAYLVAKKDSSGTWRSTTATVQAMRALLARADASKIDGPVTVAVLVDGQPVERLAITPETSDVFRLVSLRAHATGSHRVRLEIDGKARISYQLVATHYVPRGAMPASPLSLSVAYDRTELKTGELVKVTAEVGWSGSDALPMTMVVVPIPPGLRPHLHSLDALVEHGTIERYGLAGEEIQLYLRQLEPGVSVTLRWDFAAVQPVAAQAPPVRAYAYYQPEIGAFTQPIPIVIR